MLNHAADDYRDVFLGVISASAKVDVIKNCFDLENHLMTKKIFLHSNCRLIGSVLSAKLTTSETIK